MNTMEVSTATTYCYLLAQEAHRDATTWGVHLLEAVSKPHSGFARLQSAWRCVALNRHISGQYASFGRLAHADFAHARATKRISRQLLRLAGERLGFEVVFC